MNGKPTLCLDFDGVCHSYDSGWQGADVIPDPPVSGLFEFLVEAQEHFVVNIYSSRSHQDGGIEAMRNWFQKWYYTWALESKYSATNVFSELKFPDYKPGSFISLDDRGILFTGTWPDPENLLDFKPWNKEEEKNANT